MMRHTRESCLRNPTHLRNRFGGWAVILILSVNATQTLAAKPLSSGRNAGEKVPSFYVRAVTGPLQNRSVCYVCRNGSRPVAMILLRQIEPELKPLLQRLDQVVDGHRGDGLRSFCVFLSDSPRTAISQVQTFAFNHRIAVPMTIASQAVANPSNQNVHTDAAITVVLYKQQRVVDTFAFRSGTLTEDDIQTVLSATRELVSADR